MFPCNLKYLECVFSGWGNLNLPIYYVKTKSQSKKIAHVIIINKKFPNII